MLHWKTIEVFRRHADAFYFDITVFIIEYWTMNAANLLVFLNKKHEWKCCELNCRNATGDCILILISTTFYETKITYIYFENIWSWNLLQNVFFIKEWCKQNIKAVACSCLVHGVNFHITKASRGIRNIHFLCFLINLIKYEVSS